MTAPSGFPAYEVPAIVRERFPSFDPTDPSTWPEPDRCTDGRPWGVDVYPSSGVLGGNIEYRWQRYLAAFDAPTRWNQRDRGCRNRWRDEETRLCGTHVKPYRERIESARRQARSKDRHLWHVDLARQLGAYGIVADGSASGVLLQADAVEGLLRLLAAPEIAARLP